MTLEEGNQTPQSLKSCPDTESRIESRYRASLTSESRARNTHGKYKKEAKHGIQDSNRCLKGKKTPKVKDIQRPPGDSNPQPQSYSCEAVGGPRATTDRLLAST